jgi:hypothetical protein
MGLITELITADSADALEKYLVNRGLEIPPESKKILDSYIGKKYSFVISSISNVTEYRAQFPQPDDNPLFDHPSATPADILEISVRFPTTRPYFPLILTQAYGSRIVPVSITLNNYVTPIIPESITSQTKVNYYTQSVYNPPEALKSFFNNHESIAPFEYTAVRITTPSENFHDDLWFETDIPLSVTVMELIIRYPFVWGPVLYIALSMLASFIAGLILFRRRPVPVRQYLTAGLWNCATLLGFIYANHTRRLFPEESSKKRKLFILCFYCLFVLSLLAILVPLIPDLLAVIIRSLVFGVFLVPIWGFFAIISGGNFQDYFVFMSIIMTILFWGSFLPVFWYFWKK